MLSEEVEEGRRVTADGSEIVLTSYETNRMISDQ